METKRCSMCYEVKPIELFKPKNGLGSACSWCKPCRNAGARTTSFTPYLHKGERNKGVGLMAFMRAKAKYHKELRLIKACGYIPDSIEDTPKIYKMLKILQ